MSEYRSASYVGVSGVVNIEQQVELRDHADRVFDGTDAILALGVKAVHKTQWLDVPNKYGEAWYPVGENQFAEALEQGTDNIAQMYLDSKMLIANPQYATEFVRRVKRRGQNWLHMIQFDLLPYHETPEALGYLVHEAKRDVGLKEHYTIIQCHQDAMSEGPKAAIEKLKRLSPDEIDYVLFDASHGKGEDMDPEKLLRFLDEAFTDPELEGVGFGVAGGLDAVAVERYLPRLLRFFPNISWDAEGKLHRTPDGRLDLDAAKEYLTVSAEVLKSA